MKKVYFDACSWCRPFDDLAQPRNYIESEAVLESLRLCKLNSWTVAASEVLEAELLRMKDTEKLENVIGLYEDATEFLTLTDDIKKLAGVFQQHGISATELPRNMTVCIWQRRKSTAMITC